MKTLKCDKVAYASKIFAELDIARIKRISNRETFPHRAYKCPICNLWHLTSKTRNEELEIENELLKQKIKEIEKGTNIEDKELIKRLQQAISAKDNTIRSLRKTNNELITKLISK